MAIIEGQVGPRIVSDGAETEVRLGRMGCVVTTDAHGRYTENTTRGYVYSASTAVAGVAPGTALSTTPPLALWNSPGSQVNLCVLWSQLGYVSGTIGAGTVVYAYVLQQTTTPTTGTELATVCNNLSAARSRGRVFQGSTLASTPLILYPAHTLQPTLATAPAAGGFAPAAVSKDEVAGGIVVPPGAVLVMQGVAAAGTAPLVLMGMAWEEFPTIQ